MALLKVLSGDLAGSSIPVGAGSLKVGRADGNDLCLRDGSVSSRHCEIALDASGNLLVRDLGSTNGTYIEGQQIQQALVVTGQRLRLGTLEMLFDNELAPAPPAAPADHVPLNLPPPPVVHAPVRVSVASGPPPIAVAAAPVAPVQSENDCKNHPGVAAVAVCARCGGKSCAACTRQQKSGRKIIHFCACGGQCKSLDEAVAAEKAEATRTKSFGQALSRAIGYPFKGNGIILLLCGTLFYGFLDWLPKFGIMGLVVHVICWGYLFAFLQHVIVSSAAGEEEPPGFPEVTDIGSDIVQPFFQVLITGLVALGPGIWAIVELGDLAGFAVLCIGIFFYPMMILGVAMSDSYSALNPVFITSSILKIPGHYIVACFAFGFLLVFRVFAQKAIYAIEIPMLPQAVFWFVYLIVMMIACRILGMLYFLNRGKLGWGL